MNEPDFTSAGWAGRLAVLALTAAILTSGLLALYPIHSFDLWWHLRTGQLILEQGRIPHTDPFSYTAEGRPWVTHEWLSEVLFYLLYRAGGSNLLVVWKALLSALTLGLAGWAGLTGCRARERLPAAALGILLAGPLLAIRAFVRPHLLTALLLAITLLLLRKESATGRPAWRWALPPLFLLWANLHSGFLLGLGLVVLYWAGEMLSIRVGAAGPAAEPRWPGRLTALGASLLATLANPHHVEALLYPVRLVTQPAITGMISELQSPLDPQFRGALFLVFLLICTVVLAVLLPGRLRRLQGSLILPAAVFAVLALQAVRSVSELAVLLPALVAAHGERLSLRRIVAAATSAVVLLGAMGLTLLAAGPGIPMGLRENPRRIGLGVHKVNLPETAVEFLRQTNPSGRIFCTMEFSSWMIHQLWPGKQVYIDGRLDVFPPKFLEDYGTMMATGAGWDEAVSSHDIQLALVDYPNPAARSGSLHRTLREDPRWVCVFFSDNSLVYARRTPENMEIIHRFGIGFDPGLRTGKSLADFAQKASPDLFLRTQAALEQIRAQAPGEQAPALVLRQLRDLQEMPGEGNGPLEALLSRADKELAAGRGAAALETLEQAETLEPENALVQLRLGVLRARAGQLDLAEAHLIRALELHPDDRAAQQNLEQVRRLRHQ